MNTIFGYLRGRLGNQLFVYATIRAMAHQYYHDDCRILLNEKKYIQSNRLRNYLLANNIEFGEYEIPPMKNKIKKYLFDRKATFEFQYSRPKEFFKFEKKIQPFLNLAGIYVCEDGYIEPPKHMPHTMVADGFFQSERYFKNIRKVLLEELVPINSINSRANEIAKKAEESESVCVSIRLGDYISNPVHGVCKKDYYEKAIKMIKERKPGCKFFLFSDSIDEANEMLPDTDFVKENTGNMDYEKLYIMSKCKHYILSNSSFSWWTQYLSERQDKIVIAPSRWYNTEIPCDIYQDFWNIIEV